MITVLNSGTTRQSKTFGNSSAQWTASRKDFSCRYTAAFSFCSPTCHVSWFSPYSLIVTRRAFPLHSSHSTLLRCWVRQWLRSRVFWCHRQGEQSILATPLFQLCHLEKLLHYPAASSQSLADGSPPMSFSLAIVEPLLSLLGMHVSTEEDEDKEQDEEQEETYSKAVTHGSSKMTHVCQHAQRSTLELCFLMLIENQDRLTWGVSIHHWMPYAILWLVLLVAYLWDRAGNCSVWLARHLSPFGAILLQKGDASWSSRRECNYRACQIS